MEKRDVITKEWKLERLNKIREKGVDVKLLELLQQLCKTKDEGDTTFAKIPCVCGKTLSARVEIKEKSGQWYCKAIYYVYCEDDTKCILYHREHPLVLYGFFMIPKENEFPITGLDINDNDFRSREAILKKYKEKGSN